MKLTALTILMLVFNSLIISQIKSEIPKERIIDWSKVGVIDGIPKHNLQNIIDVNNYVKSDTTFDKAISKAMKQATDNDITVVFFPAGVYKFSKPISIKPNIVLVGEGAKKTKLIFNLKKKKGNCIYISGKEIKKIKYTNRITAGTDKFNLSSSLNSFIQTNILEVYQGKTEWGKSSSGKEKQYQKGQVIKIEKINGETVSLNTPIRLTYKKKDKWNEPIYIRLIKGIENCGLENLEIIREDTPPKNGGNIISFQYAYNCWLSGIKSGMGANNHVSVGHSANIEIRGSVFSRTFNTGGGGNGYGIVVGGNTSDCLFEDNIFEELRHAMIIASGANGNVFGYNASFNKPILNIDEASISVHGHYPYMNLFEGNYVEYINVDYVWGKNGEYNTFLRNYVYHKGLFGLFRNQELNVERGTDRTNIIGNLAYVSAHGKDNFILKNMLKEDLNNSMYLETFSFYYKDKPKFIPDNISWPCFGLKTSANGKTISNTIPAVERFYSDNLTVPSATR